MYDDNREGESNPLVNPTIRNRHDLRQADPAAQKI